MGKQDDGLVWMVAGGLGSMALAVLLIPLRTLTPASNLAFVFLAFTIVVAELGGRSTALVTALVSGMSLNFFLTEPYLTLAIDKRDDVIAFFALLGCGLIAASFGKRRAGLSEVANRAGTELEVLKKLVDHLRAGAPLDEILADLRTSFGLGALVLRDSDDRILGAAPVGASPASIPEARLTAETLFPSDESRLRFGAKGLRLPDGGGRVVLGTGRDVVSLDLWEGDVEGFGLDESRTLAIAAAILGLHLSRRRAGG
jgi:two-component system, OmpR family, sensor histidine kinase KdpD